VRLFQLGEDVEVFIIPQHLGPRAEAWLGAAVALDVEDGFIRTARIAGGGVGTKPWRLQACEESLAGTRLDEPAFRQAAELATTGARPLSGNGFKVELLKRTVLRALKDVGEMT